MTGQRGIQMGLLELCLLSMLSPQEPAAAVPPQMPVAATDPATWLPGEALAAVVWQASDGDTELANLWQQVRALDAMGLLRQAEGELLRVLGRTGFAADDLVDLQRGGIAVALLGFAAGNQPRFVAVAHAPQ